MGEATLRAAQRRPLLDVRNHYRALPSGGAFGFMLCKVGEALFRAVQRRLDSHHPAASQTLAW